MQTQLIAVKARVRRGLRVSKKPTHGVSVRVKPEIEKLVKIVSEKLGFVPYTIRNVAILYGLQAIVMYRARIPETDEEFRKLLQETEKIVMGMDSG